MRFSRSCLLAVLFPLVKCLTYHGADYSSLINLENSGKTYKDGGATEKFDAILHNHGVNLARIRVWTSTNNEDYSLSYGLALAKRAVALGMDLLIDLHYSDTWADPGHQAIPSSWPTTLSGLNTEIFTYTQSLVAAFSAQGTPITFLQIGNEINNGMLWPVGEISVAGYSPLSQLLNSAANGAHAADANVQVAVHLANGWDGAGVSSFYEQIFIAGEFSTSDFDVMAFSFYPFYDSAATYAALLSSLNNVVAKYGKDILIVETDWPSSGSCPGVTLSQGGIALTPAGQETWVNGIKTVLSEVSGGHGKGIVYWEPGWIGNAGLGSACSDNLVVDNSGNTLASIALFSADM
ncbi:endogalactanase [Rhodocollybia butyracea]|uniref:Arabinogalactan endo-beta-1,4-galactanase n=1 Tax=Rhodocollybia butyracea TaxID=206335 RepID=A0A9P5PRQ1_9AGAR|nr:endogalactanase [Rhodocollybia butyracea]